MATPTKVGELIKMIYEPRIQADYGMTFEEFDAYVNEHDGELPPLKDAGPFTGIAACWPHTHCSHG